MILVKAKMVDSTHLKLATPISIRQGETVLVSVAEPSDNDIKREEWLTASARSLEMAYSDSEPDYSSNMIKETNPDYEA